jgi:L-ascorbate metabolism protein UlaG (beta-lactamase superfamily)
MVAITDFEKDQFTTSGGPLEITFIGHGSLVLSFNGLVLHIDPFSKQADYSLLPKADIILLTHEHGDHMDIRAIEQVRTPGTKILCPRVCMSLFPGAVLMENGDKQVVNGIPVQAVPAYNLVHTRANGEPFHPRGEGNGYLLEFGTLRMYIAGDTENIPEMSDLKNIDIAFLPMNLPYTMTPEMVELAALSFKPRILYPYHYGHTATSKLIKLLRSEKEMEVRIRRMA